MHTVTELFDDLVAIRRAAQRLPPTTCREVRDDLEVVFARIESKLTVELQLLTEEELEETLDALSLEYNNEARAELEGLM